MRSCATRVLTNWLTWLLTSRRGWPTTLSQFTQPAANLSSMPTGKDTSALERLLRPLSRTLTVELAHALVGIQADAETQDLYDELARKHTEGQLTPGELSELEAIVRANTLLGALKAEARAFLASAKPS